MLLLGILVVILLQGSDGFNIPGIGSLFDLDGYYELTKEVVSKGQFAADRGEGINLFDDRCEVMLGELLNKVDELSEKLDVMQDHILMRMDSLELLVRGIADDVQKKFLMHKVIDSMKIVFEKHDKLVGFSKKKKLPKKKFIKFLQDVVSSGSEGVEEELQKIYRIVVRGKRTSSFEETILDVLENVLNAKKKERCDENSAQDSIYKLYSTIVTSELTGFTTIVYCAKMLEKETQNNETDMEIDLLSESVRNRMKNYVKTFQESIKKVDRMVRTCDPEKHNHVRGKTFTEMWGLIQVAIIHERLVTDSDYCNHGCETMYGKRDWYKGCYYNYRDSVAWNGYQPEDFDKCSLPRKCFGLIHTCRTIWHGNYCKVKNGTRRYENIQDSYNGGKLYGQWVGCEDSNEVYSHFSMSGDTLFSFCGNCMCICDDDTPQSLSVHIISLRESVSRSEYNRVVVGIRIIEEGMIMHIQVKDAPIGREYKIEQGKERWIYVPKMAKEIELASKSEEYRKLPDVAKEGKDYHMFKVDHGFNMNTVTLDNNRVVIGCRFAKSQRKERLDAQIEIEVKSIEYNPGTGKLLQGTERWESSTVIHDSDMLVEPKLPQNADSITMMRSEFNQYVQMRGSDWDEDAVQTTLPLFDAQSVETKPLSPFGGFGLHYRAAYERGGFIGISGYSIDYVAFLEHSEENESIDPADVRGPE